MKILILTSAILLGSVASGLAADAASIDQVPAVAEGFAWTGGYVGGQVGYVWGNSTYYEPDYDTAYNFFYDPDGFLGGVYAGYNWQLPNNLVLGAEVDIVGGSVDGDSVYYIDGVEDDSITGSAKLRWSGSLRARLGYAMDRFMPYVSGGLAFGRYAYDGFDGTDGFSASKTMTGWTAGAGVEYAVTNNLIARLEYRYTDFGDNEVAIAETNNWYRNITDLKTNDIRVGIAYKF